MLIFICNIRESYSSFPSKKNTFYLLYFLPQLLDVVYSNELIALCNDVNSPYPHASCYKAAVLQVFPSDLNDDQLTAFLRVLSHNVLTSSVECVW